MAHQYIIGYSVPWHVRLLHSSHVSSAVS